MKTLTFLALCLALASGAGVVLPSPALADDPKAGDGKEPEKPKQWIDADGVYWGDARDWKKPAEVNADSVYAQIEEYKKIVADKLQPCDPAYCVLMSKATKRFKAAVGAAAKDGGYDVVARVGAVHGVDHVPTITQGVIDKL